MFNYSFFRVPWTLKIRKEVFSPSETVQSPLAINLIFCQIVTDVFSPLCIRLSSEDRSRMKTLLDEYRYTLVLTYPYLLRIAQTCLCPDLSKFVLTCLNLSKLVLSCPNLFCSNLLILDRCFLPTVHQMYHEQKLFYLDLNLPKLV